MRCLFTASLAVLTSTLCCVPPSLAQGRAQNSASFVTTDAVAYAKRVEQRAMHSSFAVLESFGRAALERRDAEGLSRLQHVTRIMINQGDFPVAVRWNEQLARSARQQNNLRYMAIAQVNALQIRHLRDHDVSLAEMENLARRQSDWLPRVFADTALARRLFDEGRIGDALRLMVDTIPRIPQEQAGQASVAAAAWDLVSIGHIMIDDVPGSLKAAERAETYMAASSYPRPDYESVYNLTQSLSYLGRHDEALMLVQIYTRLAARTDTATASGYAGNICAFAASSREDWPGVLKCLAPYGPALNVPDVVKNSMLPFRATAYARTGQAALAQKDVDQIHGRISKKLMSFGGGVQRAEAELLIAKGDFAHGVPALRNHHLAKFQRTTRSAATAMEHVVDNMDDQLQEAAEQNRLKSEVITHQRLIATLLIMLGAFLAGLVFLLTRQRRLYREQSITDPLTGLPNRRYTEARAREVVSRAVSRDGRAMIAIVDLDHFKSCNDSFGHDAGDEALKTFALLFKETIRPGDIFGRWGGEEFLLVIPNAGPDDARTILDRVAQKAGRVNLALAPNYPLRFSGGAVDVPRSARTLEEALLVSDRRLYAAKAAGRNCVHYTG